MQAVSMKFAQDFSARYQHQIKSLDAGVLAVAAGLDGHAKPALVIKVQDMPTVERVKAALSAYGQRDNLNPVEREFVAALPRMSHCYQPAQG